MAKLVAAFLCIAPLAASGAEQGCGLPWTLPSSHFENVDFQGHVHVIESVGDLDNKLVKSPIPIYLIFNSSYGHSRYGGGFEIPILETKMVQIDERTFLLKSPSGWLIPFTRGKTPTILEGALGTKAEINGDSITIWSECGDRLVYNRGRISEIHRGDARLYYAYSGDRVSAIRDANGRTLLEVKQDPITGNMSEILFGGGKSAKFEWGSKPMVQTIQGTRLIASTIPSITGITFPDGTKKNYEFAVDSNLTPTLRLDGKEMASWNVDSKQVERAGEWSYAVKPSAQRFAGAEIVRRNPAGGKESWHLDSAKGMESISKDGVTSIRRWFASGILAGKPRSLERSGGAGAASVVEKFRYNEKGNLISFEAEGMNAQNLYDENGKLSKTVYNEGQKEVSYADNVDGTREIRISKMGKTITGIVNKEGKILSYKIENNNEVQK